MLHAYESYNIRDLIDPMDSHILGRGGVDMGVPMSGGELSP